MNEEYEAVNNNVKEMKNILTNQSNKYITFNLYLNFKRINIFFYQFNNNLERNSNDLRFFYKNFQHNYKLKFAVSIIFLRFIFRTMPPPILIYLYSSQIDGKNLSGSIPIKFSIFLSLGNNVYRFIDAIKSKDSFQIKSRIDIDANEIKFKCYIPTTMILLSWENIQMIHELINEFYYVINKLTTQKKIVQQDSSEQITNFQVEGILFLHRINILLFSVPITQYIHPLDQIMEKIEKKTQLNLENIVDNLNDSNNLQGSNDEKRNENELSFSPNIKINDQEIKQLDFKENNSDSKSNKLGFYNKVMKNVGFSFIQDNVSKVVNKIPILSQKTNRRDSKLLTMKTNSVFINSKSKNNIMESNQGQDIKSWKLIDLPIKEKWKIYMLDLNKKINENGKYLYLN